MVETLSRETLSREWGRWPHQPPSFFSFSDSTNPQYRKVGESTNPQYRKVGESTNTQYRKVGDSTNLRQTRGAKGGA